MLLPGMTGIKNELMKGGAKKKNEISGETRMKGSGELSNPHSDRSSPSSDNVCQSKGQDYSVTVIEMFDFQAEFQWSMTYKLFMWGNSLQKKGFITLSFVVVVF